jgi:hypothetical protein
VQIAIMPYEYGHSSHDRVECIQTTPREYIPQRPVFGTMRPESPQILPENGEGFPCRQVPQHLKGVSVSVTASHPFELYRQ